MFVSALCCPVSYILLASDPDNEYLVTAGSDGNVAVWFIREFLFGRNLRSPPGQALCVLVCPRLWTQARTTLAKKIVTAEIFMRLIRRAIM